MRNEPLSISDDELLRDRRSSTCRALVPFVAPLQWSEVPDQQQSRADFVAHLIATEQGHRPGRQQERATVDARMAYGTSSRPCTKAGLRMKTTI